MCENNVIKYQGKAIGLSDKYNFYKNNYDKVSQENAQLLKSNEKLEEQIIPLRNENIEFRKVLDEIILNQRELKAL